MVAVLDQPDFQQQSLTVVPAENILDFATHEVVDEVFINLPSEDDMGGVYLTFETMGIDVTVNSMLLAIQLGSDKKFVKWQVWKGNFFNKIL